MRRLLAVILLTVGLSACISDGYPLLQGGEHELAPTAVGQPVRDVVTYLLARPGDIVELVGIDPIGLPPEASVQFYFSPLLIRADGMHIIGETLEPFAGATFSVAPHASPGPDNLVGVVAEITPHSAGIFTLTGLRVRFRVNAGAIQTQELHDLIFTVCAGDPTPAVNTCSPAQPS